MDRMKQKTIEAVDACLKDKLQNDSFLCGSESGNLRLRLKRMHQSLLTGGTVARCRPFVDSGFEDYGFVDANGRIYRTGFDKNGDGLVSMNVWCPSFEISNNILVSQYNGPYVQLKGWKEWPGTGEYVESIVSLKKLVDNDISDFTRMIDKGWASWMAVPEWMLANCCHYVVERMMYWLARKKGRMLWLESRDEESYEHARLQKTANAFFRDVAEYMMLSQMQVQPEEWSRLWKDNVELREHSNENPWNVHLGSSLYTNNGIIKAVSSGMPMCPFMWIGSPAALDNPQADVSASWSSYCSVALWYNSEDKGEIMETVNVSDLLRIGNESTQCTGMQRDDAGRKNVFERMTEDDWGWELRQKPWWKDVDAARVVIQSLIEWSRPYLDNYIKMLNNSI